jgi:hypothetical protein
VITEEPSMKNEDEERPFWWPKWRTTTRPNGHPTIREHVWGWDVMLPRVVTIIAILTAGWKVSSYLHGLTAAVAAVQVEQAHSAADLPTKIAAAIAADEKTNPCVSRREWDTWKESEASSLDDVRTEMRGIRREFKDDAIYNRNILSKLPGAQENR